MSLLILYQSLSEFNLKYYIPLILNIKNEEMHLLFLHKFKLCYNDSQTATRNKQNMRWRIHLWLNSMTLICKVPQWRYEFWTDNRHLKSLVKQNSYPSVKEVSQIMGVSISTISHYLMKIGLMEKLDKWVPHESWS